MNARPVILATGGLAAVAVATMLLMHNRVAAQSAPTPKSADPAPIGIRSEAAEMRPLTFAVQATGQVAADESHTVRLSPRVGGRIVEVKVKVGDTVQPGDVVATVASSDLQAARAAYTQAKTKLELARRVLDLKQRLNGEGAFTQKQLEDAKHDYEDALTERAAAEAAVGQAKDALALAKSELARKQKLVELGGLSQKPVEDARNELSEAESDRIGGEAALAAAKTDLDRLQRLYVGGVAAKKDVDDAQVDLTTKQAAVDHARNRVEIAKTALKREQETLKAGITDSSALEAQINEVTHAEKDYASELTHLQQATERMRVTNTALEREQKIFNGGLNGDSELQEARSDYATAKLDLQSAQETLRLLGVGSPGVVNPTGAVAVIPVRASIRGVVVNRSMNVGEIVDTSTVLATLLDLRDVVVEANIQESDVSRVSDHAAAQISLSAYPGEKLSGRVSYVSREIDPETHCCKARITLSNPNSRLRPGMFVDVHLTTGDAQTALCVPSAAVLIDGDKRVIYVDRHGKYDRREVTVGAEAEGFVPVYSGLKSGERVVTTGNSLLQAEAGRKEDGGD